MRFRLRVRRITPFAFALAFLTSACATDRVPVPEMGPLAAEFGETSRGQNETRFCTEPEQSKITEISLERTYCYGTCPSYTVTLRSDGSAEYVGRGYAPQKGSFVASIEPETFQSLARYVEEIGFFERLDRRYYCEVTDNPAVYVSVRRGAEKKIIWHYAPRHLTAPAVLDVLEELIDSVAEHAHWRRR